MQSDMYKRALTLWGYHGAYVKLSSSPQVKDYPAHITLRTTFWKDEYQINFDIQCYNGNLSYEDIKGELFRILMFAGMNNTKNISEKDDIEEMLKVYLAETASFSNIQVKGTFPRYIHAHKNEIEYRMEIHFHTEEDHSLDKFDEDHDDILELDKEEIKKILKEKDISKYEVDVAPDFLSLTVSIYHNQKIHHLEIHSYYNDWFYMWSADAERIIGCYWDMLCDLDVLNISEFEEYLQEEGFFEIESIRDIFSGSISTIAYRKDCKYRIKIKTENERLSFDDMEGHVFERFCAKVLEKNGFERVKVTQGSGDQGVDIIAYKDDVKYGIQCKCYSSDIGNKAVQEVFAGKTFYQCHVGVVLTNRYFTKSAIELAQRNSIVLWNRDRLLQMVEKYYEKV